LIDDTSRAVGRPKAGEVDAARPLSTLAKVVLCVIETAYLCHHL